jgi:hypothetical protein
MRTPKGTPTGTNVFAMARLLVENKGYVPARIHAVSAPHLRRCFAAGLLVKREDGNFVPTAAGWTAIEKNAWHATCLAALAFRPSTTTETSP